MLLKLAAMDDWEPPRPWSADIILALKHYPAPAAVSTSVCMCVCVYLLYYLSLSKLLDGVAICG